MAVHRRLQLSEVGDVTVVRFVDRKILDEANIQELGQELFQLIEDENRKQPAAQFFIGRVSFQRRAGQAHHARQEGQSSWRKVETQQYSARDLRSLCHYQVEQIVRYQRRRSRRAS